MRIHLVTWVTCLVAACAPRTSVDPLPPGDAHCPAGGVAVADGTNTGYACTGLAGASVTAAALPVGDANCPNGGAAFVSGTQSSYACSAPTYQGDGGVSVSGSQLSFDTAFGDARYARATTDAGGPRVTQMQVDNGGVATVITLLFDQPVATGTLVASAFTVTTRDESSGASPWVAQVISTVSPTVVGPNPAVQITLNSLLPAGSILRVIASGTGPKPLTGSSDIPLAGAMGGPPGTTVQGVDYVGMMVLL